MNAIARFTVTLAACLALVSPFTAAAHARDYKLGSLTISHPYARTTVRGQQMGGAYLTLTNAGAADRLLSVSTDAAQSAMLHSMSMEGDVMRMREVAAVDLPAGRTVALEPGGLHIMFMGLKAPLMEGARFPLKLRFEKAGDITVEVQVEAVKPATMHDGMKHDGMKHEGMKH